MENQAELQSIGIPAWLILHEAVKSLGGSNLTFQRNQVQGGLVKSIITFEIPCTCGTNHLQKCLLSSQPKETDDSADECASRSALWYLDSKYDIKIVDISLVMCSILEHRYEHEMRGISDVFYNVQMAETILSRSLYQFENLCIMYPKKTFSATISEMSNLRVSVVKKFQEEVNLMYRRAISVVKEVESSLQQLSEEIVRNEFTATHFISFDRIKVWKRVVNISVISILILVVRELGLQSPRFVHFMCHGCKHRTEVIVFSISEKSGRMKVQVQVFGDEMETEAEANEDAARKAIFALEEKMSIKVSDFHSIARETAELDVVDAKSLRGKIIAVGMQAMDAFSKLIDDVRVIQETYNDRPIGVYAEMVDGIQRDLTVEVGEAAASIYKECTRNLDWMMRRLK